MNVPETSSRQPSSSPSSQAPPSFEFATATRIAFGAGRIAELPAIAASFRGRVLLVTGRSGRGGDGLSPALRRTVDDEPTFESLRAHIEAARTARCSVVVAIGGGSVLDAGKALAMLLANSGDPMEYAEVVGAGRAVERPAVPFIAVPTTAGTGSEVTRNAVIAAPEHRAKVSLRSPHMLPAVALVDPELALTLPPPLTAATGMDALSQLVEPFVSNRANPLVDALCREAIPRVARALPRAVADGRDRAARGEMALGALYSGMALANAGLGAVHGFAAAIGGAFPAPHGAVCAALLPEVFAENAECLAGTPAQAKFDEVARMVTGDPAARADDGARWFAELRARFAIPPLTAYGITDDDIPNLIAAARRASSMKANPVELTDDSLIRILECSL